MFHKTKCPAVGTLVQFNGHRLDVRDVLYGLIDMVFIVKMVDDDCLLTVHSYPEDSPDTHVAMGIEPRLMMDGHGKALGW